MNVEPMLLHTHRVIETRREADKQKKLNVLTSFHNLSSPRCCLPHHLYRRDRRHPDHLRCRWWRRQPCPSPERGGCAAGHGPSPGPWDPTSPPRWSCAAGTRTWCPRWWRRPPDDGGAANYRRCLPRWCRRTCCCGKSDGSGPDIWRAPGATSPAPLLAPTE